VSIALRELADAEAAVQNAKQADDERAEIDLDALEQIAKARADEMQQADKRLEALNAQHLATIALGNYTREVVRCRREHAHRLKILTEMGEPDNLRSKADQLNADLATARDRLPELEVKCNEATSREGSAKQSLQTAEERLVDLDDLSREPTCSRCNQPITPEHLDAERTLAMELLSKAQAAVSAEATAAAELRSEIAVAKGRIEALDKEHRAAVTASNAARTAHDEVVRAAAQVDAAVNASIEIRAVDEPMGRLVEQAQTEPVEVAAHALDELVNLQRATNV
jgi:hypothetical protein